MSAPALNYKDTVHLPKTGFPMKADLILREPARLAAWESAGLYHKIQDRRKAQGAPRFVLHDGPPFANGDVHMGTALNKVIKDLVLKSKTMAGFETPYVPGWDCHGLPIEFKDALRDPLRRSGAPFHRADFRGCHGALLGGVLGTRLDGDGHGRNSSVALSKQSLRSEKWKTVAE